MKLPLPPKYDYLKHFSKDDGKTRIFALALVMTPAILWGLTGLIAALFAAFRGY